MTMFIMMVGLPGSGKSHYANSLGNFGVKVHSSDAIREELWGSEATQGDNNVIFNTLAKRVNESINKGETCILDATNLSGKKRRNFVNNIKGECQKVCVVVATSLNKCLENNAKRSRVVPQNVIERMYAQFEFPLYNEGWDEIIVETPFGNEGHESASKTIEQKIEELKKYDQGNKNHTLTLGDHLERADKIYRIRYNSYVGMLHDIGKPFTRTETKMNGQSDGNSHYYNHQNTSCYESIFWLLGTKDWADMESTIETLQVIALHMEPYFIQSKEKLQEKVGLLFDEIEWLHHADLMAH